MSDACSKTWQQCRSMSGRELFIFGPSAERERVPERRGHSRYMKIVSNLGHIRSWKTMAGLITFIWMVLCEGTPGSSRD